MEVARSIVYHIDVSNWIKVQMDRQTYVALDD
jgi:hypothetical protein